MQMPMMRVKEWQNLGILSDAFSFGMKLTTSPSTTYLFQHIYAPIRTPTATGMPDSVTYEDIGLSTSEVARIYLTRFGANFWPEVWSEAAAFRIAAEAHKSEVVERMIYTIKEHLYKYHRLIELQGYSWNPLWNVDGEELHSTIEQHADETTETGTDITDTRSATPYDSTSWKDAEKLHRQGTAANNKQTRKHVQDAHSVSADMNAFGEALSAGDRYFAERTVRRGNIGVTKSTELIEAARETLRWNILEEFFRDINKVLLIGTF